MSWTSLLCFVVGSVLLADCVLSFIDKREPYYWVALRTAFRFIFCRRK